MLLFHYVLHYIALQLFPLVGVMACPANISDDYQVILIGAASVGKTCIIKKWTLNEVSGTGSDTDTAHIF